MVESDYTEDGYELEEDFVDECDVCSDGKIYKGDDYKICVECEIIICRRCHIKWNAQCEECTEDMCRDCYQLCDFCVEPICESCTNHCGECDEDDDDVENLKRWHRTCLVEHRKERHTKSRKLRGIISLKKSISTNKYKFRKNEAEMTNLLKDNTCLKSTIQSDEEKLAKALEEYGDESEELREDESGDESEELRKDSVKRQKVI